MRISPLCVVLLVCACGGGSTPPGQPDGSSDDPDASAPGPDAAEPGPDGAPPCVDLDLDGFGDGCAAGPDCDDDDPAANPAATEDCDGVDNDCDGPADEDLAAPSCALMDGVCAGATATCGGAAGWLPCGAAEYGGSYEAVEAACDALDNDCDGTTDEPPCECTPGSPPQVCGSDVGACVAGTQACNPDGTFAACMGDTGPMGETCNGEDDDCDGTTDEPGDLTAPDCPLQQGVCAGATRPCGGAAGWTGCTAAVYGPDFQLVESTCDGLDNDCDGATDESGPTGVPCECIDGDIQPCGSDVGACVGGNQVCTANTWGACLGEVGPAPETCNGVDDDCDGTPDDGLVAPACALTTGVCAGASQTCGGAAGWLACSGTASYGPQYEMPEASCDGLDNDCDGTPDEAPCTCVVGATQPCGSATGACELGTQTCSAGGWGACVGEIGPSPEACNGSDDDCDGASDDNLTPPACALTLGVCAGSTQVCGGAGGWMACDATSYGPAYVASEDGTIETQCDGLDNDCDGTTDEMCTSGPIVSGANDAIQPAVYQAHLVYLENDGANVDVWLRDLRTGVNERLTTTPTNESRPDVWGNIVVWRLGSDLIAHDLVTGTQSTLATTVIEDPHVHHNVVVWADSRGGNSDVYLYDLAGAMEYPMAATAAWEGSPDVRGSHLVYWSAASGTQRARVIDLTTSADTEQAAGTAVQTFLAADWSMFGWGDSRNATAPLTLTSNWDAFAARYATPATEDTLSTATGAQILSGVDGQVFAWSDRRNGNWDVAISAYGGAEVVLTSGPGTQAEPAISGNLIVWEDNRLGSYDIYGTAFAGVPVTTAGWIRINEVLADPASGVATDEYVELVNATDVAMNLTGCTLSDATGTRHTFPAGSVFPGVSATLVFGGGTPAGRMGGALRQVASSGALGLGDTGDTVTLRCGAGATLIDTMTYGAEGGFDESLVRSPEFSGPFVRHSTVSTTTTSPGVGVDGYAY